MNRFNEAQAVPSSSSFDPATPRCNGPPRGPEWPSRWHGYRLTLLKRATRGQSPVAVTTTKSSGRRALRVRPCGEAVVLDDQGPTSACFSAAVGRHPSLHDAAEIIFFAFVVPHLSRDDATCRTTATAHNRSSLAGLARSASARKCTLTAPSSSASRANTGTKGSSQAGGPALSIGALAGASED